MGVEIVLASLLAGLLIGNINCDLKVPDYIYWKKADIREWHQFFPSRALKEERLINNIASRFFPSNISNDLKNIVTFQQNELETAQGMMTGTNAEGCINGISNYMEQAVQEQQEAYKDCVSDVPSKLDRIGNSLDRIDDSYQASYQKALAGINACAKTYPNKDSIGRLRSCVESMDYNYYAAANKTHKSLVPSPTMRIFQNTVVACASTAARNVADKGSTFLKLLGNCASLCGTINLKEYTEELSQWTGYQDTLDVQFSCAQSNKDHQMWWVESDMIKFYGLKKQALEKYVIESREMSYYMDKMVLYLSDYYNTVTATALDNPGDRQCAADAKVNLDDIVYKGAYQSLTCDQTIVTKTKERMSNVYKNFLNMKKLMIRSGNFALLNCFAKGFVFAPNTVKNCFDLSSSAFEVIYTDVYQNSTCDVETIRTYLNLFFGVEDLPCGDSSVRQLRLAADSVLYDLQRCLYASSGTKYKVTTPSTYLSTPTTTTTINSSTTLPMIPS